VTTSGELEAVPAVKLFSSSGWRALLALGVVGVGLVACTPPPPTVRSVEPANGATNVSTTTSVVLQLSEPVDPATVDKWSVRILRPDLSLVDANYNTDAAGSLVSMTPTAPLATNTKYEVRTNNNLKTESGSSFANLRSTFTTGAGGTPSSGFTFSRSSVGGLTAPTVVTRGPDKKLYVGTAMGEIRRYNLDASGVPTGAPQVLKPLGDRTIIGMVFDPAATADNLILWVSSNTLGYRNMPNYTGKVSVLTGNGLAPRDVITGLPRSVKDHFTNGIRFGRGSDKRLYIAQGANTGYGAPNAAWGNRPEDKLSAAILVADVNVFSSPINLAPASGYDPSASGAKVKVYASGVRNAYDLVWHPNGKLYAPVNESADGNAPAGPNNPAINDLPAGRDFLADVQPGGYYGHPNPSLGKYVLNGGNPTSGVDPWEQPQYPVGVQPQAGWRRPIADLGVHRSPNGIDVYNHTSFGGRLNGHLLIAEFSNGDDILDVTLNASGGVASVKRLIAGFNNPLDLFVSAQYGTIYVLEYGDTDTGAGGALVTLRPAA
jgi:glucose/arabinose dehydrogenase